MRGGGGDTSQISPKSGDALTEAKAFLQSFDTAFATAIPATGSGLTAFDDSCYKSNGYTKAINIALFDANPTLEQAGNQYRIGSVRINNVQIIADRTINNADGSQRRELDIAYPINYRDGSVDTIDTANGVATIVSGSTHGLCASPTVSADWRHIGNQRDASVSVLARNYFSETLSKSTGARTALSSRRELQFNLRDPQAKFTYAVLSGPGTMTVTNTVTNVSTPYPFSMLLLSPKVLREDAALAGKRGNYSNWLDRDTFRQCRMANGVEGPADLANCATAGASSNAWGVTHNLMSTRTLAVSDTIFDGVGFNAGSYSFALYNDDGWKTVGGYKTKTPVATYNYKLAALPYTFAEMHSAVPGTTLTDKFPTGIAPLAASAGTNTWSVMNLPAPGTISTRWNGYNQATSIFSDAAVFRLTDVGQYFEGYPAGVAINAWPRQRFYTPTYLDSKATQGSINLTPTPASITSKSFVELSWNYSDRNGRRIYNYVNYN